MQNNVHFLACVVVVVVVVFVVGLGRDHRCGHYAPTADLFSQKCKGPGRFVYTLFFASVHLGCVHCKATINLTGFSVFHCIG